MEFRSSARGLTSAEAARLRDVAVILVRRPREDGLSMGEILKRLEDGPWNG